MKVVWYSCGVSSFIAAYLAKLEREIGHSCIKNCFLDELSPNRGRKPKPILEQ